MPRTTTSRFNPLAAILALALLLPAVASAQEAQPSTRTHTVVRHDTLWDLARKYLNDPFLWPQIYRLNTDVVEDPHWIYPGEVLRLAEPPEGIQAVPRRDIARGERLRRQGDGGRGTEHQHLIYGSARDTKARIRGLH